MNYIKRHKEVIPLIIVAFIFSIAAYNLFQNQKKRSQLLGSGAVVITSGGQCAAPNVYKPVNNEIAPTGKRTKNEADSLVMNTNLRETQTH